MNRTCIRCGARIDTDEACCISSNGVGLEHWDCSDPSGQRTQAENIRRFTAQGAETERKRIAAVFDQVRGTPHQQMAMDLALKSPAMSAADIIEFCRKLPSAPASASQTDDRTSLADLCRPISRYPTESPWTKFIEHHNAQFTVEDGVTIDHRA